MTGESTHNNGCLSPRVAMERAKGFEALNTAYYARTHSKTRYGRDAYKTKIDKTRKAFGFAPIYSSNTMKPSQLNKFTLGYVLAALWTSDPSPGQGDYMELAPLWIPSLYWMETSHLPII